MMLFLTKSVRILNIMRIFLKEKSDQGLHYLPFHKVFCGIDAPKVKLQAKSIEQSVQNFRTFSIYCNNPKYLSRQAFANSVDTIQMPQNTVYDQCPHCFPYIQQYFRHIKR